MNNFIVFILCALLLQATPAIAQTTSFNTFAWRPYFFKGNPPAPPAQFIILDRVGIPWDNNGSVDNSVTTVNNLCK